MAGYFRQLLQRGDSRNLSPGLPLCNDRSVRSHQFGKFGLGEPDPEPGFCYGGLDTSTLFHRHRS
jgi:hypothetical protein